MISRHDLVWLDGAGWDQARAQLIDDGAGQAGADLWQRKDWPAVARRREPGLADGEIALGLPLPPAADGSKGRAAFAVTAACIARTSAPIALARAREAAPMAWQAAVDALLADMGGMPIAVFGSLAMQALTGLAYVRPASDLDVLVTPAHRSELAAVTGLLQRHAAQLPLDGEIVFPGGAAVAWREWAQADSVAGARVMVKSLDGVHLSARQALIERLAPS